ncbi:MAG TPA: NAD(P)-dependent oxidoreductase [Candidatus Limnocylindrales bacterium]|nr:NAD(P)-dependent oxidoreductase [Candidatus Limnocylindrales bacterium]
MGESVGVVGLGTMGGAMAANLARAGFPVRVWNRTAGRTAALEALGAQVAPDPAALAAASDVVLVCVSDTPDVEQVLFGDRGVAAGIRRGSLVIDCSSISPSATRDFAARLADSGVGYVDAPVSGGSEGARHATLTIFCGGSPADVGRAEPVLRALGTSVTHFGPVGSGQAVKAVNQVMIAGGYLAVAEGLLLAMRAGLDPARVAEALAGGAAGSWILANRSTRMIENQYPLGFRTSLHLKDLGIALGMARELGVAMPVAALTAQLEAGLVARGYGDEDVSNVARAIRALSAPEDDAAPGT